MPRKPMSVCAEPGCPKLTRDRRCDDHERERRRAEGTTTQRGYGWDHQQLTAQAIARQPWCSVCGESREQVEARGDKLTGGHIVARADGGQNVASNYRAECGHCNYGRRGDGPTADSPDDPPPTGPVFA